MTHQITHFNDLDLAEFLQKALAKLEFTTPSPVQAETIPHLLAQRDVIAQAQTGTGKTAAFALPILQQINLQTTHTQALILAPTRELAIQVATQFEAFAAFERHITVATLCGGQDYSRQLKQLRGGAQIVVGTPGRILDHIDRGTLKLDNLATFVLDEADEMLRMGFIEDVESILSKIPAKRQIALFSATMPYRIKQIAYNYLKDPISVEIKAETATVKSIEQRFVFASPIQKPDTLLRVLAVEAFQGLMIFVRTKSSTEEVAGLLQAQGYRAVAIHGDITQSLREKIVAQFRQGSIDILVATDVAARGLDVERVTHVINYDVPHDCETYVHRIGRTGRAGRAGSTILFITPRESRILNTIERHTKQRIEKMNPPSDADIQRVKKQRFMDNVHSRLEHEHIASYQHIIQSFTEQYPDIALKDIAAALALLIHKDKPWQQNLPAVKAPKAPMSSSRSSGSFGSRDNDRNRGPKRTNFKSPDGFRGERGERGQFDDSRELFRLDVGRVHGVKPGNIVGAIANEAGLPSRHITGLKIHDNYSTVFLPKNMSKEAVEGMAKAWVCSRQLKVTPMRAAENA